MPRKKKTTTYTSGAISFAVHAALFGLGFYFAVKTGLVPEQVVRMFNLQPPPKKEKPPVPQPESVPTQSEMSEPAPANAPPPPNAPPVAQPLTSQAASAAAPAASGGTPVFQAQARAPGQPRAPAIQPQTKAGTALVPDGPPRTASAAPVGPVSAFSAAAGKPSTIATILEERRTSAAVQDAFSSEQISRSVTRDAGEVVAKITGASIVDGKTAVVRGLSDRYTAATLNGADVPSADAYRKSAQLDLFNANMIDRVVTTKTFTPDLPGGFAGGAINIVTKSFPAKQFTTLSIGSGFNSEANLRSDFLSYNGGQTDWAGIDDGTRALPAPLADPKSVSAGSIRTEAEAQRLNALNTLFGSRQLAPTRNHSSPINNSFALSAGDTSWLGGRPFGYFFGVNFNRSFRQTRDGFSAEFADAATPLKTFPEDLRSGAESSWSTTASIASLLHPQHELVFTFLWNQTAEDNVMTRKGRDLQTGGDETEILNHNSIQFIERQLHTFQLRGTHRLPQLNHSYLEWLASLSNTTQEEPDLRIFNYFSYRQEDGSLANTIGQNTLYPNFPTRIFRLLDEDNRNLKVDYHFPFHQWSGRDSELKLGAFHSLSERRFTERTFVYRTPATAKDDTFFNGGEPNNFLDPPNLGFVKSGQFFELYRRLDADPQIGNQQYNGRQEIRAAYLMVDLPLTSRLRFTGGARLESTALDIKSDSRAVTGKELALKTADWLPAAGFLTQITSNLTLHGNYGRTIARPTYRERANYRSYDPVRNQVVDGNAELKRTIIDNYDLRLELFPRPGEVISLGAFYKSLKDPIEQFQISLTDSIVSFVNRDKATVWGVEFEYRKSLDFLDPAFRAFSLGVNAAYLNSKVEMLRQEALAKGFTSRPLYDQSPYIVNGDLTYDQPRTGTLLTVLANLTGERIFLSTPNGPDIYENPPIMLDCSLSQRIGRGVKLKLSAQNLLDARFTRTYGPNDQKLVYSSFRVGRTYSLSLNFDF